MSFIDDLENCFHDALSLEDDMKNVISSLKKKDYFEGLIQIKKVFTELKDAVEYCKSAKVAFLTIIKLFKKIIFIWFVLT